MSIQTNLVPGSDLRISKDGYEFDANSDYWTLNKNVRIPFSDDVNNIDAGCLNGFRMALARTAEELSADHTLNMCMRFQRFIRDTKSSAVGINSLQNWRAMLDSEHEWYLGALKGFLIAWFDWGYEGITKDEIDYLEELTLKGNTKGRAVALRCPYTGAFTDVESLAIENELVRLFKNDSIDLLTLTYVTLLKATGRRPIQLSHIKAKDIQKSLELNPHTNLREPKFTLSIPRAKQRYGSFRSEFSSIEITEELYLTLYHLIRKNQLAVDQILRRKVDWGLVPESKELPLFIDFETVIEANANSSISKEIWGKDLFHLSTKDLRAQLKKFYRAQRAISERTGDIIQISARRFRHTIGTKMGQQGHTAHVIAKRLDHSDTQNCMIYVENTVHTAEYIDRKMSKALAPLSRAFKGEIIAVLEEGKRGDDPTARIPNNDNEVVGACGTNDFCVKGYEACYVCDSFHPLLDAPHEKFLEDLHKEKERLYRVTGSEQFASTKDTVILAVEEVIRLCHEEKIRRGMIVNG